MRMNVPLILAAALVASAPAGAQDANNTADANAVAPAAPVTDVNATAPVAPDANAVAPIAEPTTTTTTDVTTAPAPEEKKGGFPWGVLGLLGLLGLIPRKGR
jgi:hypothetical protein